MESNCRIVTHCPGNWSHDRPGPILWAVRSILISPEVRLRLFDFKDENEIPKEKT